MTDNTFDILDILDIIEFKTEKAFDIIIESSLNDINKDYYTESVLDTLSNFFNTIYDNIKKLIDRVVDTIKRFFDEASIDKKIKKLEKAVKEHPTFANKKVKTYNFKSAFNTYENIIKKVKTSRSKNEFTVIYENYLHGSELDKLKYMEIRISEAIDYVIDAKTQKLNELKQREREAKENIEICEKQCKEFLKQNDGKNNEKIEFEKLKATFILKVLRYEITVFITSLKIILSDSFNMYKEIGCHIIVTDWLKKYNYQGDDKSGVITFKGKKYKVTRDNDKPTAAYEYRNIINLNDIELCNANTDSDRDITLLHEIGHLETIGATNRDIPYAKRMKKISDDVDKIKNEYIEDFNKTVDKDIDEIYGNSNKTAIDKKASEVTSRIIKTTGSAYINADAAINKVGEKIRVTVAAPPKKLSKEQREKYKQYDENTEKLKKYDKSNENSHANVAEFQADSYAAAHVGAKAVSKHIRNAYKKPVKNLIKNQGINKNTIATIKNDVMIDVRQRQKALKDKSVNRSVYKEQADIIEEILDL